MQSDPSTYTDDVKAGAERFFSHWGARCALMDAIRLRVKVGRLYNTKRNPPKIGDDDEGARRRASAPQPRHLAPHRLRRRRAEPPSSPS